MSLNRRLRRLEELQNFKGISRAEKEMLRARAYFIELRLFQDKTDNEIKLLIEDDPLLMREWIKKDDPLPMTLEQEEVEKRLFK